MHLKCEDNILQDVMLQLVITNRVVTYCHVIKFTKTKQLIEAQTERQ